MKDQKKPMLFTAKSFGVAFLLSIATTGWASFTHYDIDFSPLPSQMLQGSFEYDASSLQFADFTVIWKRGGVIPNPYTPPDPNYEQWFEDCGSKPCIVQETWTFDFTANANLNSLGAFSILSKENPALDYGFYGVIGPTVSNFFTFGSAGLDWSLWTNSVSMTTDNANPNYFVLHPFDANGPYAISAAIPEPEIYAMMGLGLGLLGWVGRRRKLAA